MGLLKDDKEWETTLQEAAILAHHQNYCEVSDTMKLYLSGYLQETVCLYLDLLRGVRHSETLGKASCMSHVKNIHINDLELKNYVFYELEVILNNLSKSL